MGRINTIIGLLFILLASACEEKKEHVIDYSDVVQESERYNENERKNVESDVVLTKDSSLIVQEMFISNGIAVNSVQFLEKRMFPERFGPINSEKFQLNRVEDTILFYNWTYADSLQTMNSFFNWLDDFGDKGLSFQVGEEKRMQVQPFYIFVGDTNLIFIESSQKLNEKEWENYLSLVGIEKIHYFLKQNKYAKVHWYSYLDRKKEELN